MTHTRSTELIDGWIDWLESGNLSPNTVRNRRYTMGTFLRQYPDLQAVTLADIQTHLASLAGGAQCRVGHLAALRSFYKWAHLSGHVDHNPTALSRSIRVPEKQMPPCPKKVLDRALLLTCDYDAKFMLLLGSRAGLRREEIATFSAACVGANHLTIMGKGSKQRRIPIHPDLRPYCDELVRTGGWAFVSHVLPGCHVVPDTVARAVNDALGGPWTTHSLRRYFATSAYRATRDLRSVQALLGHSSPTTTAKYIAAEDDAMTAAVLAVA